VASIFDGVAFAAMQTTGLDAVDARGQGTPCA
jgi:hypothetical protein